MRTVTQSGPVRRARRLKQPTQRARLPAAPRPQERQEGDSRPGADVPAELHRQLALAPQAKTEETLPFPLGKHRTEHDEDGAHLE